MRLAARELSRALTFLEQGEAEKGQECRNIPMRTEQSYIAQRGRVRGMLVAVRGPFMIIRAARDTDICQQNTAACTHKTW